MNDRNTGIVKLRMIEGKNSKQIPKCIVSAFKKKKGRIHIITSDIGREFADHKYVSKKLGIDFYFASPYSSWQRGSNGNLNGLIRQYFPQKTNFDTNSIEEVKKVENQLNKRLFKRYGFKSPIQEYNFLTKAAFAT